MLQSVLFSSRPIRAIGRKADGSEYRTDCSILDQDRYYDSVTVQTQIYGYPAGRIELTVRYFLKKVENESESGEQKI